MYKSGMKRWDAKAPHPFMGRGDILPECYGMLGAQRPFMGLGDLY